MFPASRLVKEAKENPSELYMYMYACNIHDCCNVEYVTVVSQISAHYNNHDDSHDYQTITCTH